MELERLRFKTRKVRIKNVEAREHQENDEEKKGNIMIGSKTGFLAICEI